MYKSTNKPGLVKAHLRVVLARVELKKALTEYSALKFAPLPDVSEAVKVVTTPAVPVQAVGLPCLFPQPRYEGLLPPRFTGSSVSWDDLQPDFEDESFHFGVRDLDAVPYVPSGGVVLSSHAASSWSTASVYRA